MLKMVTAVESIRENILFAFTEFCVYTKSRSLKKK